MSVIECKVRFTNTKGNTAARNTEASGVFNRHEGLALLTTIVEGGGNCNPASDPLPNQSLLSASIINKILHLIDALDLLCRRSYIALDQLLLDTQEALKIAYPKCLSGLSAYHNTSSVCTAALRAKKSATKLKRSAEMGSMYRHLRDRSSRRRRFSPAWRQELARQESPGVAGGRRQGRWCRSWHGRRIGRDDQEVRARTANTIDIDHDLEILVVIFACYDNIGTERSAYFRQIEEDVGTHPAAILELRDAVGAFQSMDMGELARFHCSSRVRPGAHYKPAHSPRARLLCHGAVHARRVPAGQPDWLPLLVLARFEGFPSKKLEALRMAAALYSKLDGVVATPSILNMQKKNSYFLKNMYIYKGLV
uniref:Uncharacterized protein n=1 Tax=Oryza glumipatula TaxID=40148 RepID=A0A0D9YZU8_9ORYZ